MGFVVNFEYCLVIYNFSLSKKQNIISPVIKIDNQKILKEMKIVVIGATGTLGKEIVKLGKERGYTVIEASRKSENSVNIDNPESVEKFLESIPEVDAIICAAGNASSGAVDKLTDEEIQLGIKSKLMGQINIVRKGMDKVKNGGTVLLTGGFLAYKPWLHSSNLAMVNSGLEGFARAAALEMKDGKRITVMHPPLVKETAVRMGAKTEQWPAAAEVAKVYLDTLKSSTVEIPVYFKGYEP